MTPDAIVLAVQTQEQVSPVLSALPLVLMFAIFYFLLIRPQQKKQQEHQKFLSALEKNQDVVTSGGLHGTIVALKDSTVTLRIADNVKVDVERSCISHAQAK